ncbi:MAG: winged helix-turn-helix transcriptional regulator [Chlorobi bacterium]|nr:winged helix-turn-helix transcriptional regulator [Chlorobiota bacterium]
MHEIEPYFSESEIGDLANKFKILSEPSRLKILRLLFEGEKCVTDIIEATGLMQANVSKQLKVLQMNNILGCRPQGLKRYYRVTDATVKQICNLLCDTAETCT